MYKAYARSGVTWMRPHVVGEDMTGISVSDADMQSGALDKPGGMVARNESNHLDKWYVAKEWFEDNYLLDCVEISG